MISDVDWGNRGLDGEFGDEKIKKNYSLIHRMFHCFFLKEINLFFKSDTKDSLIH